LRRNVDIQFLLFNNEIYGLTKGQYSPTSRVGTRSPSTPMGSIEAPVQTAAFALGAGARFVARGIDTDQKRLPGLLKRAYEHKGASFVEIYQNCIVYNDGVFSAFTEKSVAEDHQLHLEHGQPMIFGKDQDKGIRLQPGKIWIEAVTLGQDGVTEDDILVHDETNITMASMLAGMRPPDFPVPLGVLYCNPRPSYAHQVYEQIEAARANGDGKGDMNALLRRGYTWTVQ
jgi:2-oxoglutarate ferredoxin oxidoreductase subunit beta